jgi:hypothetical protein
MPEHVKEEVRVSRTRDRCRALQGAAGRMVEASDRETQEAAFMEVTFWYLKLSKIFSHPIDSKSL